MRRGILGIPVDGTIDGISTKHVSKNSMGFDLSRTITAEAQSGLNMETVFYRGSGLKETVEEDMEWRFDKKNRRLKKTKTETKKQLKTEFLSAPSTENKDNDGFVLTDNNEGVFLFQLIGEQNNCPFERATMKLGDFYFDCDNFSVSTGGHDNRPDNATTVMAWGDHVEEDGSLSESFHKAVEKNEIVQLAGEYNSMLGRTHLNMSRSGYIEIYTSEITKPEFLDWIRSEVLPHVEEKETSPGDIFDEESRDKVDEDQTEMTAYC